MINDGSRSRIDRKRNVGTYDPATFTTGGNDLLVNNVPAAKFHAEWDAVPALLKPSHADELAVAAKNVAMTAGSLPDWPASWASESLRDAKKAFAGIKFAAKAGKTWGATLPASYSKKMATIKTERIESAGARLAQILMAIWP